MIALCLRGLLPLLCLACVTSFVQSEDNVGQQALDDDDADGFFRFNRQFYRFGRAFSPLWDSDDDSRKNHLIHWAGYPISPVIDNDAFSRSNREFYRFGRAYPPYQDKRFLRFGRSVQSESSDYPHFLVVHPDNQLYRKRRSPSLGSQSDSLKVLAGKSESEKSSLVGKELQKRATTPEEAKTDDQLSYNIVVSADDDKDKRFMRFGKRFMRFGRGDEEDEDLNKRFMRFGKRFMRFGRGSEDEDQMEDKRFMRFGKRFMRFGRGDEQDQEEDKRFMRFGKSPDNDEDYGKRFMRFGKRFMRFGRGYEDDENDLTNAEKEVEDKRFMRFGKRSKRESDKELSSNSLVKAAASVAS